MAAGSCITFKINPLPPPEEVAAGIHICKKIDDSGEGQRFLQEHLGHASFNTTAKYRKVAGEELKKWYGKLWDEEAKQNGNSTE